jgi:hypothetical protein
MHVRGRVLGNVNVLVKGPGQYVCACPGERSWARYSRVQVNCPGQCIHVYRWRVLSTVFACPGELSCAMYFSVQVKGLGNVIVCPGEWSCAMYLHVQVKVLGNVFACPGKGSWANIFTCPEWRVLGKCIHVYKWRVLGNVFTCTGEGSWAMY